MTVSPPNSRRPVSISYSTTPNAQMSARLSAVRPRACSGAHVSGGAENHALLRHRRRQHRRARQRHCGAAAARRWRDHRARPKSSTFTTSSSRRLMFAGLRSRWMMPASCAASSASAIWPRRATARRATSAPSVAMNLRERAAGHQLHHENAVAVLRADMLRLPVDLRDVRVIERGEHLRLPPEPARGVRDRRRAPRAGLSARRRD